MLAIKSHFFFVGPYSDGTSTEQFIARSKRPFIYWRRNRRGHRQYRTRIQIPVMGSFFGCDKDMGRFIGKYHTVWFLFTNMVEVVKRRYWANAMITKKTPFIRGGYHNCEFEKVSRFTDIQTTTVMQWSWRSSIEFTKKQDFFCRMLAWKEYQ